MFEHYIGIDLHQAFFQACAVTVTACVGGSVSPDGRGHCRLAGAVYAAHCDGGRSQYPDVALRRRGV